MHKSFPSSAPWHRFRAARAGPARRTLAAPLALLSVLTASCTSRSFHSHAEDPAGARPLDRSTVINRASEILGRVQAQNTPLRAALDSRSETLCSLKDGDALRVLRFEGGFFKVKAEGSCARAGHDAGWIWGEHVDIPSNAYAGFTEVKGNSAFTVDMNYAGKAIFCTDGKCRIKAPLYGKNRCLLRPEPARFLQNAAIALQRAKGGGWKLKLLDCYRPAYVQERMFKLVPDANWVANLDRARGNYSRHNRGLAVDLTLEENGREVDMGSGYDEFTERSVFDAAGIGARQRANRALLREVMQGAKFVPYEGEWWHFSWEGSDSASDVPL